MEVPFWVWWLGGTTVIYVIDRIYSKYRWEYLLEANSHLDAGNFEESLKASEAASKRFPNDWRPLVTAAGACLQLHDPEQALTLCNKAQNLVRRIPIELHINRAVARAVLQDPIGALEDANHALLIARTLSGLLTRAFVYVHQYRYAEALDDCNEAMQLKQNIDGFLSRCWVFIELNNLAAAKSDCHWMLENLSSRSRSREVAAVLRLHAIILSLEGMNTEAIEEQSRAIELENHDPLFFINRAYFLLLAKDLDKAVLDLEHAYELAKTDYARAYIASNQARIAIVKNDLEMALTLADQAVSLCERPEILCTRAAAYVLSGGVDKAEEDLGKAHSLNPLHAETYWWKGRLLEIRGNAKEAEENKEKALEWHYIPYI